MFIFSESEAQGRDNKKETGAGVLVVMGARSSSVLLYSRKLVPLLVGSLTLTQYNDEGE